MALPTYHGDLTVREARAHYFAANGFGDGGYTARWVKLQAGPFPIYIPNTSARVRAVRLHDVHHVLTEYATTWTGEAEIAAWEIASGCAHHHAAWFLNLNAMAIGLFIAPRAAVRAFLRGRHSSNIYRTQLDDTLLSEPVAVLRQRLRLEREPGPPTLRDRAAFAAWAIASLVTLLVSIGLGLAPAGFVLALLLR